jgi:ATPase subunit of ABC transporter with duplicated ATPase domains
MISHDRWLLDRVATHILAFEDDGTQVKAASFLVIRRHH